VVEVVGVVLGVVEGVVEGVVDGMLDPDREYAAASQLCYEVLRWNMWYGIWRGLTHTEPESMVCLDIPASLVAEVSTTQMMAG
jgi:hypothetical protein